MIDWAQLKDFERANAEQLCRYFFPQGKRIGREWRIGDVTGKPGLSSDSIGRPVRRFLAGLGDGRKG